LCRLENGLEANINENDADFFGARGDAGSVEVGNIITGRVDEIKYENDTTFQINLKCKPSHLASHKNYLEKLGFNDEEESRIPPEELVNQNIKEDRLATQKKLLFQPRKIQHGRFKNMTSGQAITLL